MKKTFVIGAVVVAAGALGWLAFGGIGQNLVYYRTPTELVAAGPQALGATIRLGGQVKPGTLRWQPEKTDLKFVVTDGTKDVDVHATTVPPQMFREGIGVVLEGSLAASGIFETRRLLVKHSNAYQEPHDAEDLKTLMRDAVKGTAQ